MSTRVQTALLALLAVATAVFCVLALRPPEPAGSGSLVVPTASRAPAFASSAPATPSPTVAGTSPVAARPVIATGGRSKPVVAFLGDSYVAGVGAARPATRGYVGQLADTLGWDTTAATIPGGGYIAPGRGGPLIALISSTDLRELDPDLVVLQAGNNDVRLAVGELRGRVVEAVEAVRAVAPRAQVVVVGVLWPAAPPATARIADEALQAGAAAARALFSYTYDLRFDAAGGNRPNDDGYAKIAERLQSSFNDLGLVARQ